MGTPRLEQFKGVLEWRGGLRRATGHEGLQEAGSGGPGSPRGAFEAAGGGAAGFGARRRQVDRLTSGSLCSSP